MQPTDFVYAKRNLTIGLRITTKEYIAYALLIDNFLKRDARKTALLNTRN